MVKKISIARALKEKARLIGQINKLWNQINKENIKRKSFDLTPAADGSRSAIPSIEELNAARKFDVKANLQTYMNMRKRLIDLKVAITKANAEAADILVKLTEAKSWLFTLTNLAVAENDVRQSHGEAVVCFSAVDPEDHIVMQNEATAQVNDLQDQIDEFNATHFIEFDFS